MKKEEINSYKIDRLLVRCLEGIASEQDYSMAWEWIRQNDRNKEYYEQLRDIWMYSHVFGTKDKSDASPAWINFRNKHLQDNSLKSKSGVLIKNQHFIYRLLRIAAIFLAVFFFGGVTSRIIFNNINNIGGTGSYVIEASRGAKSFVTMPDGTQIWLNADSKITCSRDYNLRNRDLYLTGEAFFKVSKNKKIPFTVHSSGIIVKALGTSFNVKAYPEENIIETTLVEGRVSIESKGTDGKERKVLMEPNEKASFYKISEKLTINPGTTTNANRIDKVEEKISRIEVLKKIDTEKYTSWKDKRWIFEDQKLGDFAVLLERLYDIKITFNDEELKSYRLSGSFEEENLEQVLKAIQFTVPLNYSIQHHEVTFSVNTEYRGSYEEVLKTTNTN